MTLKSKFVLSSAALVFGALLSTSAFVGCSGSGTVNNPPQTTTDTTKMVFTAAETTRFDQADVNTGSPETVTRNGKYFTQSVLTLTTSTPFLGKTATILKNTYSDVTIAPDSDIYSQDASNDDLYKIDLCLEPINSNALIVNYLGGKVHIGWVLEAKLKSPAGTKWAAINQTVNTTSAGVLTINDTATMMADTTFMLGGKVYTDIKHVHHSFAASAGLGNANAEFDIYISPSLGTPVIYWIHQISSTFGPQKGLQNVLVSHN
jgi:hypothetical protein